MANEFVARKGLISSGSINVSGSVTASYFTGDGSQLTNIVPAGTVSSSVQIATLLPASTVSSSSQINTGSFSGSITSASYATNALFVLNSSFSGSFTGSFTGDGSDLTFIAINTSQSSDNQLLIGNKHNNYQYRQTTIFKNGDIVVSGSATITEEGVLILKPRGTPNSLIPGTMFFSSSGDLFLGTA